MRCGVLALQGDWAAHLAALRRLGAEAVPVRTARELADVTALVIPGGESTSMLTLMRPEGLLERIRDQIAAGMPALGTCAGVILLSDRVEPDQPSLGLLPCRVLRNAYGRQLDSAVARVDLTPAMGSPSTMDGVFIRAPRILEVADDVEVLGRRDHDPVLVRHGRIVAATFHPELTEDLRVHRLLLDCAACSCYEAPAGSAVAG